METEKQIYKLCSCLNYLNMKSGSICAHCEIEKCSVCFRLIDPLHNASTCKTYFCGQTDFFDFASKLCCSSLKTKTKIWVEEALVCFINVNNSKLFFTLNELQNTLKEIFGPLYSYFELNMEERDIESALNWFLYLLTRCYAVDSGYSDSVIQILKRNIFFLNPAKQIFSLFDIQTKKVVKLIELKNHIDLQLKEEGNKFVIVDFIKDSKIYLKMRPVFIDLFDLKLEWKCKKRDMESDQE